MTAALIGFACVIALALAGVRIAFASLLVGIVGIASVRGLDAAFTVTGQQVIENATNYNLSVIPLFILMGVLIYRADLSSDLYDSAYAALGTLRGGLAHATVLACAGFSAVCGSSLATAATMTKVAVPSMRRRGYDDRLATGTVAAGGTLGIMIPPSVPLVIYGIVAEQDVGRLFVAALVPGLLLVASFLLVVSLTVRFRPDMAPAGERLPADAARRALAGTVPVLLLFALVLGGIYGGVFTPTEAGGMGALGAAAIAVARGHLRSVSEWREALAEAATSTAAIFAVIFGTLVFSQYVNLSGMPYDLVDLVLDLGLGPVGLVAAVAVLAILMGMIFESIGILLLLVPVFLPALIDTGVDLIWFGIVVVLVTELGLITPPVGMNVFIVRATASDATLGSVFAGVVPFALAMLLVLGALLASPGIATLLPRLLD